MERLKLETIENIISVEKTTIEAFEKYGECASLDKCIIRGMEELKQYRIAEEQGLLLRLPVAEGTPVWTVMCGMTGKNPALFRQDFEVAMLQYWGKAVFLTRTEAEQALKRMEKEND